MEGIGVMLKYLGGNKDSVDVFTSNLGKVISKVYLDKDMNALRFEFSDGSKMKIFDDGQSCCEHRFIETDDDLSEFVGSKLIGAEVKDAPDQPDDWGVHEVQFLEVITDNGSFTCSNHNEHNGYYGGFWVICANDDNDND